MSEQIYLIIDCGASNVRALSATFNGKTFSFEEVHRFENRPVMAAGTLYWDLLFLFSQIKLSIEMAVKKYGEIKSIGIDTWGVDFGFIDKNGKILANPINYRDVRRNTVSGELFSLIDKDELYKSTGIFQLSIMSAFCLLAMKLDKSSEFILADKFLMMPDLFNYLLTGVAANEYTVATTSMLYNPMKKSWENKILDILGVERSLFSKTVMPGTQIGQLQKTICEEINVPPIPVTAVASHDTASAIAGIPVREPDKKWAFLNIGTWAVMGTETEKPVLSSEILESGIGNEGSADGRSFLARNITGLWIIQECRNSWIRERGTDISWSEIVDAAEKAQGFMGYIDVDDALFAGVQPDMPALIVSRCKEKGFTISNDMGSIARVVFESLVMKFREVLYVIEDFSQTRFELLHMIGGGTRNRLLCQWTADLLGVDVVAGPAETTAVGNLLAQLVGTGEVKSFQEGRIIALASSKTESYNPVSVQEWQQAYETYRKCISA